LLLFGKNNQVEQLLFTPKRTKVDPKYQNARIIPFFDYPPKIRKVIYTTIAIESINMSLRIVITTLFYLALRNISKKWAMPIRGWKIALNRFTIQFE